MSHVFDKKSKGNVLVLRSWVCHFKTCPHDSERDIVPEDLPAAEDVKKVERRLASEEKKAVENKKN